MTINPAKLIHSLEKSIKWHSTNQNDPYNVGNAVIVALAEIKAAVLLAQEDKDENRPEGGGK